MALMSLESKSKIILILFIISFSCKIIFPAHAVSTQISTNWAKTFGSSSPEVAYQMQETPDGGYILSGLTSMRGSQDVYLIKTDSNGIESWVKIIGNDHIDEKAFAFTLTSDGGFLIAGRNVSGPNGGMDVFLLKTDGSGNIIWTRNFGESGNDYALCVRETSDYGFIISGVKNAVNYGDIYLLKTDSEGNLEWSNTYGNIGSGGGYSVVQTGDNGYVISGTSSGNVFVVKTDSLGNEVWSNTYGSGVSRSVEQTSSGNILVAGDGRALMLDDAGNKLWEETFGFNTVEINSVVEVEDGGLFLTGLSGTGGSTSWDVYALKMDTSGNILWDVYFSGNLADYGYSGIQSSNGEYLIAGLTQSYGSGAEDVYFISFSVNGTTVNQTVNHLAIFKQGSGSTYPSLGNYTYAEGSEVPIEATPGSGWELSHWLLDDSNIGSANPYTVTMNQNHTLTAVFTETPTQSNWNVTLTSVLGEYFSIVTVGMNESATTGFDIGRGDTLTSPAPPTGLYSYLWHPDNPPGPIDQKKLSTSLFPLEYPAEWTIHVRTIGSNGEVSISWNSTYLSESTTTYVVHLVTPSGSIDMHSSGQYTWISEADTTYVFTLQIGLGVIIDQTYISDSRVDVGTNQTLGFHGYWLENSSDVTEGVFYVNNISYPVNSSGWVNIETYQSEVGEQTWTVTGVLCGDMTSFSQETADPALIWDRVEIYESGATVERAGPQVKSTIWFKARFAYDDIPLEGGSGQLHANRTTLTWSQTSSRWEMNVSRRVPGNATFLVSEVDEEIYGLTAFTDIAGPVTVYFTGEWSASLSVDVAGSSADLIIGLDEEATVGFDVGVGDALVSPAPPNGVSAYLDHPDNPSSPVDLRKLSTSLLPVEYPAEWTLKVQTIGVSGEASINWSSSEIDAIPFNYSVTLDTPSGGVDMRSGDSYGWVADADTTYTFMISITSEVEFTLELNIGWNMVSIPVIPDDHSAASVLSDVGFFQLVTWSGTGYVPATSFEAGKGYWLLVLEDVNVTITGIPVDSLSLSLSTGWSMIGGTYDEVQAADVFPGFYQLVTWTGTGYIPATVFEPGRGYWSLVLTETQIQLPPT